MSDVADGVKKIVAKHLNIDASRVALEASLIDDLVADRLDAIELMMTFEETLNIEISEEAAVNIITVKDAIDHIEKQQAT